VILHAPGSLLPAVGPEPDQVQDEFKGLDKNHEIHRKTPLLARGLFPYLLIRKNGRISAGKRVFFSLFRKFPFF